MVLFFLLHPDSGRHYPINDTFHYYYHMIEWHMVHTHTHIKNSMFILYHIISLNWNWNENMKKIWKWKILPIPLVLGSIFFLFFQYLFWFLLHSNISWIVRVCVSVHVGQKDGPKNYIIIPYINGSLSFILGDISLFCFTEEFGVVRGGGRMLASFGKWFRQKKINQTKTKNIWNWI